MRNRLPVFLGLLAAVALCAAPALAADTLQVRFVDQSGQQLLGNGLTVASGGVTERYHPDAQGVYHLRVSWGAKIGLQLAGPRQAFAPVTVIVPEERGEVLDITMRPPAVVAMRSGEPVNDDCDNPTSVSPGSTVSGSTFGATDDPEAFLCGSAAAATAPGVWYTLTGSGKEITLSTCNQATYDTQLSVYCADCEDLICIDGNDDTPGCAGFTTELTFCAQDHAEYQILVHGFSGATGNFDLTITEGASCDPTVECPVGCGNPDAGDCFDPAGNGTPFCDVADCCWSVCQSDPFCCNVVWDGLCAAEAEELCEPLLAVVDDFTAEVTPEGVQLRWNTIMEIDHLGFNVLRSRGHRAMEQINTELITARGSALDGASYGFLDGSRQAPGTVQYYLQDLDLWGRTTLHGPVTVELERPNRRIPLDSRPGTPRGTR
jgi:hypothetical protein